MVLTDYYSISDATSMCASNIVVCVDRKPNLEPSDPQNVGDNVVSNHVLGMGEAISYLVQIRGNCNESSFIVACMADDYAISAYEPSVTLFIIDLNVSISMDFTTDVTSLSYYGSNHVPSVIGEATQTGVVFTTYVNFVGFIMGV